MGLASFYKIIGSPVRRAIQLLGALAFVPEGDVFEVYHKIKPTLTDDVGEFLEYMESTWIVRRKKWVALEQQQLDQCDQYDFDKAEEFLAYMGYTTFTPVQRHLVDE